MKEVFDSQNQHGSLLYGLDIDFSENYLNSYSISFYDKKFCFNQL